MWPEGLTEDEPEQQTEHSINQTSHLLQVTDNETGINNIINIHNYSSLIKLLRVTAWIIRFCQTVRAKVTEISDGPTNQNLTALETNNAENEWVKTVQLVFMKDQKQCKHLQPFKDKNGLIRIRGRIHSDDPEHQYQKLIPKNHPFTALVIQSCHKKLHRAVARQTLAQLRQEYWIPNGLSQVQKVLCQCRVCRHWEDGPFLTPESPPLPDFRIDYSYPFKNVGLDYFGPLFIKDVNNVQEKVWVCLFTCASIWAVHLGLVDDLSTDQFLMCLRRFVARFGAPNQLISDSGTQFKSANKFLSSINQAENVQGFSASNGIQWKFISELAPWMSGFYESLVGTVKSALRKTLGQSCLTLIQLQTVLSEICVTVNSRLLVSTGYDVGEEALTPNHFLMRSRRTHISSDIELDDSIHDKWLHSKEQLLSTWLKGQNLLNQFWICWKSECLASLKDRPAPVLFS